MKNIKRIAPGALVVAALAVAPAQAANQGGHGHQGEHGKAHQEHGKSHKCKAHRVGWTVRGTLVSAELTQDENGRYDGTVTVDVTGANKHARDQKGEQPYELTDVKANFGGPDRNADGTSDAADLAAGDRVKLIGKLAKVSKKCESADSDGPAIRKADFKAPADDSTSTETEDTSTDQ